jgi:hypothetical protein
VGLTNLGSESKTCVGSHVHLVGVSISIEKNFYRLPFTPPSLVRRIGPSLVEEEETPVEEIDGEERNSGSASLVRRCAARGELK